MHHVELLDKLTTLLKDIKGLEALVLGGSYAAGNQHPDSDIDLGLYYTEDNPLDIQQIRNIVSQLTDTPDPIVTGFGEWGRWVNGGAWLTISGQRVDFLYRNIDFVSTIIDECNQGITQFDFYQQPPYGFHSYIYCAEIQLCKTLHDPSLAIQKLKAKITHYPQLLKYRIINGLTWDASFSLMNAKKAATRGNTYFVAGCLTRIASDLVQVLYALNEMFFISDKSLAQDEVKFTIKPSNFSSRINTILVSIGSDPKLLGDTLSKVENLLSEVITLCGNQYTPKYS